MFEIHIYPEQVINDDKYNKLLEFLLRKCDKVALAIPNYGTTFSFDKRDTIFEEYHKLKTHLIRNQPEHRNYILKVNKMFDKIDFAFQKKYTNITYFDNVYNYEVETRIYTYNEEVFKVFKEVGGLYKWCYPNFPEDLFFFKNDKIFLESISHESDCWIYDDDKETIDFIDELGLDYCVYEDDVE